MFAKEDEVKPVEILDEIETGWDESDLGDVKGCIDEFTQFDGEF